MHKECNKEEEILIFISWGYPPQNYTNDHIHTCMYIHSDIHVHIYTCMYVSRTCLVLWTQMPTDQIMQKKV